MGKVIRSVFIFSLVLVLTSCEYWNKDMLGYLEYWGNTVQMGRLEVNLGGSSQKNKAGVDAIPVSSTPIITGYIINPQGYPLVDDIGDDSTPNIAVRVSDSDVKDKTKLVAQSLTMLQVKLDAADNTLEHRTVTVNMEAIRSDTLVSAGVVMGVTFQYNTPPAKPMPVVKTDTGEYKLVLGGERWEASEGKLYWAYYDEQDEKKPNCAKYFKVGDNLKSLDECLDSNATITGSNYKVFYAQTGSASTSVAAVDSERVTGPAIVSGQVVPSRPAHITYKGNGSNNDNNAPAPQSFEKGTQVTLANQGNLRRSGYSFGGWNTQSDGLGITYQAGQTVSFPGDTILYAKWNPMTEFYVSSSNGSDDASHDGSEQYPFKTIGKALDFIVANNDGNQNFIINVSGNCVAEKIADNNSVVNIVPKNNTNLTLTIQGKGGQPATIDANQFGRVMYIGGKANVTLQDITLTGGNTSNGGGVYIASGGSLTLEDGATISGNTATTSGGGVYVTGSGTTFTMANGATISGNTANSNGGGVYLSNGTFTMNGGSINGNKATGTAASNGGGGVYVNNSGTFTMNGGTIGGTDTEKNTARSGGGVYNLGTFTMENGAIIRGNTASSGGGGVRNEGTFTMNGGTIGGTDTEKNTANSNGGGVYNTDNGEFTMKTGATISGNTANSNGGGVDNRGTFTMENGATITDNTASSDGGGVHLQGGTFTMSGTATISGNTASSGGGVYLYGGIFTMSGTATITDNTASSGGGVYVTGYGTTTMNGGSINDNKATGTTALNGGGGVYLYSGTFTMSGGSINGNKATGTVALNGGGGVYLYSGKFTMEDGATISGNTANNYGGGVYVNIRSSLTMETGATISGNKAASQGGGVFVDSGTFNGTGKAGVKDNKPDEIYPKPSTP